MKRWLLNKLLPHYAEELNRRVEVEDVLWRAAAGKCPLPNAQECRRLAQRLGIPGWVPGPMPRTYA